MQTPKKILILGGDGFIGWPLALSLSKRGDDVVIIDNFIRREIDKELGVQSLTPICTMEERLAAWKEITGKAITFYQLDISLYFEELLEIVKKEQPSTIVDLAKIKSAPYSMRSSKHRRRTLDNNLGGCESVLSAILESGRDIHLVHIGTMGVYGYNPPTSEPLPEGYIKVKVPNANPKTQTEELVDWEILYPANPGSIYHLTKTQEALHFQMYNRLHGIRITDLHQGVVWGTATDETAMDPRLINRFDYDGDYGTILNRFLIQSAVGHPLTVYGTGGQTRAFIHVKDCVRCLTLAIDNPPKKTDKVHIYNQATQCLKVLDLADLICNLNPGTQIGFLSNPRKEVPQNELDVVNSTLLGLGLQPTLLNDSLSIELISIAKKYKDRVDMEKIKPAVTWNKDMKIAYANPIPAIESSQSSMAKNPSERMVLPFESRVVCV